MNASSSLSGCPPKTTEDLLLLLLLLLLLAKQQQQQQQPGCSSDDDDDDDDFEANFDQKLRERHVFWVPSFYETLKSNPFKKKKKILV